jgi:hypothetical protein
MSHPDLKRALLNPQRSDHFLEHLRYRLEGMGHHAINPKTNLLIFKFVVNHTGDESG